MINSKPFFKICILLTDTPCRLQFVMQCKLNLQIEDIVHRHPLKIPVNFLSLKNLNLLKYQKTMFRLTHIFLNDINRLLL